MGSGSGRTALAGAELGCRYGLGGAGDPARRPGTRGDPGADSRPDPPRAAAAAVDAHYGLKDRLVSAVDFVGRTLNDAARPPVADAEHHLQGSTRAAWCRSVFRSPCRSPPSPPSWRSDCSSGRGRPPFRPAAEPLENVLAAAEEAEESLEELDEAARRENDPRLKELVQKLNESIEQMKQPGVDVKEALAKLSEMQAAIAAQQAQFNVGLVDAQMQALGEALASTQSLDGAGQALQQGNYDKAADQLEQADPSSTARKPRTSRRS